MYIFLAVAVYLAITIATLIIGDMLIRHQYNYHRDLWVKSGKPRGFLFSPDGSSYFAYCRQTFKKTSKAFSWVHGDVKAERLLRVLHGLETAITWYSIIFLPLIMMLVVFT